MPDGYKWGQFKSKTHAQSLIASKVFFNVSVNSKTSASSSVNPIAIVDGSFDSHTKTGEMVTESASGLITQMAGMYLGVAAYEGLQSDLPSQILVPGTFASHNRTTSSVSGDTRHYKNEPRRKRPGEIIYIFDRNETLVLTLNNLPYNANQTDMRGAIPYKDGAFTEELNGDVTLEFSALATVPEVARIENEGRAVTRDMDGNFVEFIIREIEDDYSDDRFKAVTAEGGEFELIDEFLPGYTEANVSFTTALEAVLEGTRYKMGEIDDFYGDQSVDLKNMTVRKSVHDLIDQWGGEVRYRVEVKNNRITHRYIDVFKERGGDTGKRFVAGKDIKSVNRTFDSTDVKTALYGRGESDEDGERLTFGDIEWKESDGDPVDKPKGQTWIGDMDAMEKWGYKGGRRHKFGFYDGQEKDPAALLLKTWEELQKQKELQDTYEVEVVQLGEILNYPHEKVRLGDKVRVINHDMFPELESQAQVIEYEQNLNDPRQSKVTLGHFRAKLDTDRRATETQKEWNDKKGELEKKPDKVKNELQGEVKEAQRKAEKKIEEAKKELEESVDKIDNSKITLGDVQKEIDDSRGNHHDYVGNFDGDIAADNLVLRGKLKGEGADITGTINAKELVLQEAHIEKGLIQDAKLKNVTITGELDSPTGTFAGTVYADEIKGNEISGVTFRTGTKNDYRMHMTEQELYFYQGSKAKMRMGFRDSDGKTVQRPYIVMGEGKSNGRSKFFIEKNSDDITLAYSTKNGYSSLTMNYSGSSRLKAEGDYLYLDAGYKVKAETDFEAPDIKQTSSEKYKTNIGKLETDALDVIKDIDVYRYDMKKDIEKGVEDNGKIGFIAEKSEAIQSGETIELTSAIGYSWKAIQELTKRVEALEA